MNRSRIHDYIGFFTILAPDFLGIMCLSVVKGLCHRAIVALVFRILVGLKTLPTRAGSEIPVKKVITRNNVEVTVHYGQITGNRGKQSSEFVLLAFQSELQTFQKSNIHSHLKNFINLALVIENGRRLDHHITVTPV